MMLSDIQRATGERVTVVFHRTFPNEGLVHFIRRHAHARIGTRPMSARVERREGMWEIALRVDGVRIMERAPDAFIAARSAFDQLR